jgi:multidrug resistance protein, MATE family
MQKLGFGLSGAAAAASLTNILQPILLLLYVRFVIPSSLECWPGFSWTALKNWGAMIRLAIPGILMIEAEWLAFDILTFSSAYLGEAQLAAQSVLFNVSVLMYHLPFPASIAASTRLGNLIGSGSLRAARIAANTYYIVFVGIGLFDLSFLVALKDVIPKIFSNDDQVRRIVSTVMPLVATFQLVDSTTALCNGLLRGLGRQYIGGWTNLLVYYVVSGSSTICLTDASSSDDISQFSIPASLFLTFGPPHLGLWALWTGPAAGLAAITIVVSIFLKRISWQKCVEEARWRSE